MATKTSRRYFVAINTYRNSTSDGFANTWEVMECVSKAQQSRVLREGLPVSDSWLLDDDGNRSPVVTTTGIRAATAAEIRAAKRDGYIPMLEAVEG